VFGSGENGISRERHGCRVGATSVIVNNSKGFLCNSNFMYDGLVDSEKDILICWC